MPVKVLGQAKSRLAVLAGARRPALALALASDTVAAVGRCPEVARLLVVTSDPVAEAALAGLGARVEPDRPDDGLNAALEHGAAVAARRWPGSGIAALTADLPALRPGELATALRAAADGAPSSFVADAARVGTTMYAVPPGGDFAPRFGGESRARHARHGAAELVLEAIAGLRRDVDTPDDLRAAVSLGAGPRTTALAGELLKSARSGRSASG